jgi:DNA-binding transcriptional LysR family regulator
MANRIDWESQIGRRLRLRDLHVFRTVARFQNMAKAAAELGVSQPTISEAILDLEHAVGVRLLDRSRRGVEPNIYGQALLRRVIAAFDELTQGIHEIDHLTDARTGEVRVGCPESVAATLLSPVVLQFTRTYPSVRISIFNINTPTVDIPQLRDRNLDLAIIRSPLPRLEDSRSDDMLVEYLYNDDLVIAVGTQSSFASRRKVDLIELANEPWILTPPGAAIYNYIIREFRTRGIPEPTRIIGTQTAGLRGDLLATGTYVAPLPRSIFELYAKQFPLKAVAIDLPPREWPIALVTLKDRTLTPIVQRFIGATREAATALSGNTKRPARGSAKG